MLTILKSISFHSAVVILASIIFTVIGASKYTGYLQLFIWFSFCGLILFFLSYLTGAYKFRYWSEAETLGGTIVIIVGHLGPASTVYFYIQMLKSGYGSGVIFLPSLLWSFLLYTIGIFWCLAQIVAVKIAEDS